MIKDKTTPLDGRMGQVYHVHSVATSEGGIELNHSLTITNVQRSDLGDYSCVAINSGGMSEDQVVLTFDNPGGGGGFLKGIGERELTIIIGVACGVLLILAVLLILICCCCRSRSKGKAAHSPHGSVLYPADPESDKLLPVNGVGHRINPIQKPVRTGQYSGGPGEETEMLSYGPSSYVPGDRYDELGEGRTSASNSDQTGTLSRYQTAAILLLFGREHCLISSYLQSKL